MKCIRSFFFPLLFVPVSTAAAFAGLDGKPSDHYLWLTGEAAKRLRKEKPLEP